MTIIDRRRAIQLITSLASFTILPLKLNFSVENDEQFHFVGLGGAGSNIVEYFHRKGIKGRFTCITNPERPGLSSDIRFIDFKPPCRSLYLNNKEVYKIYNPDQIIEVPLSVKNLIESDENYVLLVGLGGYTGTNLLLELTKLLQSKEKKFIILCSIPFSFEGQKTKSIAYKAVTNIDNQIKLKVYDPDQIIGKNKNLPLNQAFKKVDEHLYKSFCTITEL
jgi:cell division GTPase FtsZ